MSDRLTDFGFTFGPAEVMGYVLDVRTASACVQLHITPRGQRINVHPVPSRGERA